MKSTGLVLGIALMSFPAVAFAQSDAQRAFDQMKTVAGSWEAHVTTVPPAPDIEGKLARVSLRVTSMGNAIVHEARSEGRPDDPITMFYLDGDRLLLTHYCDAGNRPRMIGKVSPDGKTVEFEYLDIVGSTKYGHMHHAVFTFIDANHHIEDWTYMLPGDKPVQAHFDLQRAK
jgi:phage tail protein X